MTNMAQAISQMGLKQAPPRPVDKPCERKTALQIAKQIFAIASKPKDGSAGYTMRHSPEKWAKLWLPSSEFVLMEIDIAAAASPHLPRNPERVAQRLLCSAEDHEPVIVDLNKRKVGKTMLGYIPEIIYLDGKHRIHAQSMQGRTKTWAWVGVKAIPKLKRTRLITKLEAAAVLLPKVDQTRMSKTYELYASTTPSVGIPVTRQDSGEGGARPSTSVVRSAKKLKSAGGGAAGGPGASNSGGSGFNPAREGFEAEGDCGCNEMAANSTYGETKGARSSGQLADPSASDTKVPQSASDGGPGVSPSDRRKWLDEPNDNPPGSQGWGDYGDPAKESPGSGSGPHIGKSLGDSKSVLRTDVRKAKSTKQQPEVKRHRIVRAGKKVGEIWNDKAHGKNCDCAACKKKMKAAKGGR